MVRWCSRAYQEDGVPGGEGQDVGAGHPVPALRVAVHRLGVHHRAEPLQLQRHAVGAPPLVVAGSVDQHH